MSTKKIKTETTEFETRITNAHEALESAGLNYTVCEAEVMNTATGKISNGIKSLYRSDNNEEVGVVGIGYHPIQNSMAFSYFDIICQTQGAHYTKATSINGGEKIILTAEFPRPVVIGKNDEVKKQFQLINGFNGKVNWSVVFMLERLICSNGLRAVVADAKNSYKFKHTPNIEIRMEDTLKVFHGGIKYFNEFISMSNKLTQKHADAIMVEKFLDDCFGVPESTRANTKRDEIKGYFEHGVGNNGSNLFELYNSVTEYVTHKHGKSDEKRIEYANFGSGVKLSECAFNSVVSML